MTPDQRNSELEPCASVGGPNRNGFAVVFEGGGPSAQIFENDGEREGCFGESRIESKNGGEFAFRLGQQFLPGQRVAEV